MQLRLCVPVKIWWKSHPTYRIFFQVRMKFTTNHKKILWHKLLIKYNIKIRKRRTSLLLIVLNMVWSICRRQLISSNKMTCYNEIEEPSPKNTYIFKNCTSCSLHYSQKTIYLLRSIYMLQLRGSYTGCEPKTTAMLIWRDRKMAYMVKRPTPKILLGRISLEGKTIRAHIRLAVRKPTVMHKPLSGAIT